MRTAQKQRRGSVTLMRTAQRQCDADADSV